MKAKILALLLSLLPSLAMAQSAPANLPAQTVFGRLGQPGDTGPGQAIPFAILGAQLLGGAVNPNLIYAGPPSGIAATPAFRALVNADIPTAISIASLALGGCSIGSNAFCVTGTFQFNSSGTFSGTPLFQAPSGTTTINIRDGVPTSTMAISVSSTTAKITENASPLELDAGTGGTINIGQLVLNTNGSVSMSGALNNSVGYQVGGAATSGNVLRGNGTNFVNAQLATTDLSGLAAGIATWFATPTSANLAAALTDETGTGSAVFGTSPNITTPNIVGTTAAGNATAGSVGEEIKATVVSGSAVSLTTNTPKTVITLALTAGDWEVSANCSYNGAGSVSITFVECSMSLVTNVVDQSPGVNTQFTTPANVPGVSPAYSLPVQPMRFNVSSPTSVFLVYNQTFTVGTLTGWGIIRARRIR